MAKRKTSVYCLLLLAVLVLTISFVSVGETQARYVNTVVWNTYVEPAAEEAEQVRFTAAEPMTVLLGEMNEDKYAVQFSIQSPTGASGSLTWSEDAELEIRMQQEDTPLDRNHPLTLSADTPTKLILILKDRGEPRDAKTVQVTVTWTEIPGEGETEEAPEMLTAAFQVELPAVEEEPTTEETTAPGTEEITEPTTEDTSEPATTETTAPATEETVEPATAETTAPVTEETTAPVTEETTAPAEDDPSVPAGDDPSEPAPETPTEPALPKQEVFLEALEYCGPSNTVPIWITVENTATVELGLGIYPDAMSPAELRPFPRCTRFSLDQGKSWFLLYKADTVTLDLESGTTPLLLDLSGAELAANSSLTLMAEGWSETTQPGYGTASVTPVDQPCVMESRILTRNTPLRLTLTEHWPIPLEDTGEAEETEENASGYQFTYSIERLTVTGTADEGYRKEYEPVDPAEGSLNTALTADESGQVLTIWTGNSLPPAGTYRVSLKWMYTDICIEQTQMTFFINYPRNTDSAQTGGAEQ